MWHAKVDYETQLDTMILLQRLVEHFAAAVFTVDHTRPIDAVRMVVPLCIAAIADVMMRKCAVDIPSAVCLHLMGGGAGGAEIGNSGRGFAFGPGALAQQAATIVCFTPEINVARSRALDYFEGVAARTHPIFQWDKTERLEPAMVRFFEGLCPKLAFPLGPIITPSYVADAGALCGKNHPEWLCYRDVGYYMKLFLNPQSDYLPQTQEPGWRQRDAELSFSWDTDRKVFKVKAFQGMQLSCRPRLKRGEMPPVHRCARGAL